MRLFSFGSFLLVEPSAPSLPSVTRPVFFGNAPLIAVTISFAAGIILPRILPAPVSSWLLLALAAFFACTALIAQRARLATLSLLFTLSFFLVLGIMRSPLPESPTDSYHISQHFQELREQEEVVLLGILQVPPAYREHDTRLILEVKELWTSATRKACRGRVQLAVAGEPISLLAPGDTLLARAKLSVPQEAGTPGAFDYRAFLAQQSIWVTGRVSSAAHVMRLDSSTSEPLLHTLRYLPERARQRIGSFLDLHLPEQIRGLYKAIIIGDLTGIPEPLLEQFRSTGTMHLLAISGMNIGLITFTVTFVAWWFLSRSQWVLLYLPARKITLCLAIPFMLLYAFVAGFQAPVVRALIMVLVFISATLLDRQWQVANNIAIAALLILSFSPGDLFSASFQLSFAAVIGISLFSESLRRLIDEGNRKTNPPPLAVKLRNWLLAGLLTSLAATAGTLPLMLYHFNRFSLLSPISTPLVEPFLCFWAQMPGLLACLFIPLFPKVADAFLVFGGLGVHASAWLVEQLARVPGREIWLPTPGMPEIVTWYALILIIPLWKQKRWARIAGTLAAIILIAIPVATSWRRQHASELRVHFLDVGQGSATLAELPVGRTILIDAGGHETDRFNVGEDIVAPFLWKKGIASLDSIVVTHPHADHVNGLPFLVDRFQPATIWVNSDEETSPMMAALHTAAKRAKSRISPVASGDVLFSTDAVSLRCLGRFGEPSAGQQPSFPGESETAREIDLNKAGLVLRLDGDGRSFLFPGDIGEEEEKSLLAQGVDLGVDVLLAPHHGSRTSSSEAFVRASHARFVVISAGGRKNVFPAAEVRERYENLGARILETRQDGAITFTSSRDGLQVETFRKRMKAKGGK